jgi:hypothetical protein
MIPTVAPRLGRLSNRNVPLDMALPHRLITSLERCRNPVCPRGKKYVLSGFLHGKF